MVRGEAARTPCGSGERSSTVACRTASASTSGFLHWLALDRQARRLPLAVGPRARARARRALARAYDLIVFAGHHEYVTTREYDLVERYRDLGGNLMFLSANNYFWRVERHGDVIEKSGRWRDLGRPESALIGVQYIGLPAIARGVHGSCGGRRRDAWLLKGTELRLGSPFGRGGVEIDHVTKASPARIAGGRRDPEPLRAGQDGADDLLRDEQRSASVRRRRLPLHPRDHDGLRRLAAARERLGQADAMTLVRDVTRIRP